jgi:hypothetical protein
MTPKAAKATAQHFISEGMPASPASGQGRPLHGSIEIGLGVVETHGIGHGEFLFVQRVKVILPPSSRRTPSCAPIWRRHTKNKTLRGLRALRGESPFCRGSASRPDDPPKKPTPLAAGLPH